jgi:hypothetical protein
MYLAFALLQLNIVRWEQIMRKANSGIRRQLTGTKQQIIYNFSQFYWFTFVAKILENGALWSILQTPLSCVAS